MMLARLRYRALAVIGALLASGCPAGDQTTPSDAGAHDGNADVEQDSGSDWDPVWHLTDPKAWESIGPEGQPDCGVGCRVLLNRPVPTATAYAFSYDSARIVSEGVQVGPLLGEINSTETLVVGPQPKSGDTLLQPYVANSRATFLHNFGAGHGQVGVTDLVTGETKVAYEYTPATAGTNNVTRTALNSRYAFWAMDGKGIMSRDLQTGDVKLWMPGSYLCHDVCATEHQLLCADLGVVYEVNLDTGENGFLDNGGALQTEGFCSPDRSQFAWIDYRDPPGQSSTYDSARSGGEVYLRDLTTNKTRRITYDSPSSPRGKDFPVVDGTRVFWNETPDGPDQNPAQAQDLYALTTVLVRFDLATGQECKLGGAVVHGYKAAYASKIVTLWLDPGSDQLRVVLIDLDDPGLQWQCEVVPIPP